MRYRVPITILFFVASVFFTKAHFALASVSDGTINVTYHTSRLCSGADCTPGTVVNWRPTGGTAVHIADAGVTGDIWSTSVGYITLNPSSGGVTINTTTGVMSGYAFGSSASWVNFGPFSNSGTAQVTVNTNGELNGYAWVSGPGGGWMHFSCNTGDSDYPGACVKTDWRPLGSRGGGTTGSTGSTTSGSSGGGTGVVFGTAGGSGTATTAGTTGTTATGTTSGTAGTTSTTGTTGTGSTTSSGTSAGTGSGASGGVGGGIGGSTSGASGGSSSGSTGGTSGSSSGTGSTGSSGAGSSAGTGSTGSTGSIGDAISGGIGSIVQVLGSLFVNFSDNFNFQSLQDSFANPVAQSIARIIATTGAIVTAGITIAEAMAVNVGSFQQFASLPLRLWSLLLGFFGLRKKPWGTVYDSVTKQPIDPAYVVLQDLMGNEMGTSITDLDGRYGFLVKPGQYKIIANKTNYIFPSTKLAGQTHDELYTDLYFGDVITISSEGEIIAKNIPMDALKFDWNEFAKRDQKLMKFYNARSKTLKRIANWFFYVGFVLATIAFFTSPVLYNTIIFSLYIIIGILRSTGLGARKLGGIVDKATGQVLPFAIIRVYSTSTKTQIMHRVANQEGQYYCLLQNGNYYVTIEKKNADATYTLIHTSMPFEVTKGYINSTFEI